MSTLHIDEMQNRVKKYLLDDGYTYTKLNDIDLKIIYDLYYQDIICHDHDKLSAIVSRYYGHYFMTEYEHAMIDTYYTAAVDYYSLAISKGDLCSVVHLGNYYKEVNDFENMKKYYLMAIEKGHIKSMINLAYFYRHQKDYDNMFKYYFMAVDNDNKIGKKFLQEIIRDNEIMDKFFKFVIGNKKQIDVLQIKNNILEQENNHLKYMPNGQGYLEAKKDFEQNMKNNEIFY